MVMQRPAPLTGSNEEKIRQLYDFICQLVDKINETDVKSEIFEEDFGTGVPLRLQLEAVKNILGGSTNG